MAPSEAEPELGLTRTQESELLAVQSRLAVKEIVLLAPSAETSMLVGLVSESEGAFWQEARRTSAAQSANQRYLRVIIVVVNAGYAPRPCQ